jgi:hypothetical protein
LNKLRQRPEEENKRLKQLLAEAGVEQGDLRIEALREL